MAKKPDDKPREPVRLKIDQPWDEAAEKLLRTPAKSTPPRQPKPRKKKG